MNSSLQDDWLDLRALTGRWGVHVATTLDRTWGQPMPSTPSAFDISEHQDQDFGERRMFSCRFHASIDLSLIGGCWLAWLAASSRLAASSACPAARLPRSSSAHKIWTDDCSAKLRCLKTRVRSCEFTCNLRWMRLISKFVFRWHKICLRDVGFFEEFVTELFTWGKVPSNSLGS